MLRRLFPVLLLLTIFANRADAYHVLEGYADACWNNLTGYSSYQHVRLGTRTGDEEFNLSLRNEWYDTRGTRLPYQYNEQGTTIGAGYRHWFPGNKFFGEVSTGVGVLGANSGRLDFRSGFAGYNAWESGKRFTDLYGELYYVGRALDTFGSLRFRPGHILHQDTRGRLWAYGVGLLSASGTGANGTDNRIEAGAGLGYLFHGTMTANIELREGYAYRGTITSRSYFNPTAVVAGNF